MGNVHDPQAGQVGPPYAEERSKGTFQAELENDKNRKLLKKKANLTTRREDAVPAKQGRSINRLVFSI